MQFAMECNNDFFTSCSDSDTIPLLLALYQKNHPCMLTEFYDVMTNFQTMKRKFDRMQDEGLVQITMNYTPRKQSSIVLTDKGKSISMMLSMVSLVVSPDKEPKDKSIFFRYADPILRLIKHKGEVKQCEFVDVMLNFRSVVKVLNALESDGIINRTVTTTGHKTNLFTLTKVGQTIADVYEQIFNAIKSQ